MPDSLHVSSQFDEDLARLRTHVLQMGGLVETQISSAIDAYSTGEVASVKSIIETDRKLKAAENDQEASFEEHLRQLRALGFGHVVPVFLEARYGGIVAYK